MRSANYASTPVFTARKLIYIIIHITGYHQLICPKKEINCSNNVCETRFLREDEQNHLSICPYQKVTCKYKDFGCVVEPLRKDLAAHEKDSETHLCMTMDSLLETKKN